jgi:hypothetical protein
LISERRSRTIAGRQPGFQARSSVK